MAQVYILVLLDPQAGLAVLQPLSVIISWLLPLPKKSATATALPPQRRSPAVPRLSVIAVNVFTRLLINMVVFEP